MAIYQIGVGFYESCGKKRNGVRIKRHVAVYKCDCGERVILRCDHRKTSCGCDTKKRMSDSHRRRTSKRHLKGHECETMVVHGRLTQIGRSFQVMSKTMRKRKAVFRCECGTVFVGDYHSCTCRNKSCGCLTVESLKAGKHNVNRIPKHGMTNTKVYNAWTNIVQRCTNSQNKHFHNYGGRGITVCNEWRLSFKTFYDHVGDPPTKMHAIDRIKNDIGYEPGNVRWVTRKENQRNRRNTFYVDYQGEKLPLSRVCELRGVSADLVRGRLVLGWDLESAITKPRKVNVTNHE